MGSVYLSGDNIELCSLEKEDADFIAETRNHPEMHSLLLQKEPITLEETEEMLEDDDIDLLITKDGEKLGAISIMSIDFKQSNCSIGYFIIPEQQGNGYAQEAVKMVLKHIFEELGIHKVSALTYEHNSASQKVLENSGFEKEGTLIEEKYIKGEHRDCPRYGITRDYWMKS